ncbi:hypothetical protein AM571_PC00498 (plasmid) [Rhizobium etli 8C-3]|uniref:Uncharacterized protein n=1 Tax=Rhizobium etli 8C-3 TaxID=538025 RepID=A0A1L5PDY1_RHIET|nr:hypothetical protein AM571_PC00498 [Rhizobium etli 8C-3]
MLRLPLLISKGEAATATQSGTCAVASAAPLEGVLRFLRGRKLPANRGAPIAASVLPGLLHGN